jgi:hypothetical protein
VELEREDCCDVIGELRTAMEAAATRTHNLQSYNSYRRLGDIEGESIGTDVCDHRPQLPTVLALPSCDCRFDIIETQRMGDDERIPRSKLIRHWRFEISILINLFKRLENRQ